MMQVDHYEFADGAHFQAGADKSDPAAVAGHLDLLRRQAAGQLTPEKVVEDARHDNSPLHSFFEWDDSVAAHQHRLAQARGLIRAVVAVYRADDEVPVKQRAFVHVAEAQAPHYQETRAALADLKTREAVLQRAWSELQQWKCRYKDLTEFARLVAVIDQLGDEPSEAREG